MKPRHPRRAGRKPIDHLGSIRALSKTLSLALTRLGVATPTPRQDIAAQFRRSKYFQKRAPVSDGVASATSVLSAAPVENAALIPARNPTSPRRKETP